MASGSPRRPHRQARSGVLYREEDFAPCRRLRSTIVSISKKKGNKKKNATKSSLNSSLTLQSKERAEAVQLQRVIDKSLLDKAPKTSMHLHKKSLEDLPSTRVHCLTSSFDNNNAEKDVMGYLFDLKDVTMDQVGYNFQCLLDVASAVILEGDIPVCKSKNSKGGSLKVQDLENQLHSFPMENPQNDRKEKGYEAPTEDASDNTGCRRRKPMKVEEDGGRKDMDSVVSLGQAMIARNARFAVSKIENLSAASCKTKLFQANKKLVTIYGGKENIPTCPFTSFTESAQSSSWQVADALSRRPKVNAVSIATHNDLSSMIDEYAIDPDFKDVISAIALGKKEEPFTMEDGYLLHGNRLCITHSLREKVMYESHAPPYAGHRGIQSTLRAIETYFYRPTMKRDIPDYVSKCVVCQKTKFDREKQPGLLQPLPIPDSPWESISMDFIFGLPKSIHGNTGIWTIVDRFSKQAHFIPVKKTIKAHQMATLFISQIFKYHGLPSSIVLDRDPRMTSNFWKGLFENLGTRLNFSSAYHPQTDGQSEIANLTILDLLKSYVTEVDQRSQWEKYLPLVEYAYNNTVHTSTGKAPFEVIEGRSKSLLLLKVHGKIFAVDEYSRDLKESFQKIKEAIFISQQKQKAAANKHRRALAFKENDWVLLKFPKARLRHTLGKNPIGHQKYYAKLAKRYYGPFQILKPINEMAYQLKLPNHWLIHNAFHVSLLKPYKGEPPSEAIMEDPPEVEDQEEGLMYTRVAKNLDVQSLVLSGPQGSLANSHVANPWSGRLRREVRPTSSINVSKKGKEEADEGMRIPNVTAGQDDVDGHSSVSKHSLDEELGILAIRILGTRTSDAIRDRTSGVARPPIQELTTAPL
ncbi:hypothetical protein L7F22_004646 [Adiantum nelumboides]|nr:hypothetical protein [Adiantum nelumboides]